MNVTTPAHIELFLWEFFQDVLCVPNSRTSSLLLLSSKEKVNQCTVPFGITGVSYLHPHAKNAACCMAGRKRKEAPWLLIRILVPLGASLPFRFMGWSWVWMLVGDLCRLCELFVSWDDQKLWPVHPLLIWVLISFFVLLWRLHLYRNWELKLFINLYCNNVALCEKLYMIWMGLEDEKNTFYQIVRWCYNNFRTVCAAYDGPTRKLGDMSSVLRELASPEAIEELEKGEMAESSIPQAQFRQTNKACVNVLERNSYCMIGWSVRTRIQCVIICLCQLVCTVF